MDAVLRSMWISCCFSVCLLVMLTVQIKIWIFVVVGLVIILFYFVLALFKYQTLDSFQFYCFRATCIVITNGYNVVWFRVFCFSLEISARYVPAFIQHIAFSLGFSCIHTFCVFTGCLRNLMHYMNVFKWNIFNLNFGCTSRSFQFKWKNKKKYE